MIKVFGQTDKVYTSNGDIVVKPLKAKVHKQDNGDYYLDIETSLDYIDYFTEGRIIVANTPTGDQAFRIGNVNKTKNKIETRCYHVFYDSENYLIADSYVVDKNCDEALKHLNNATEPQSEFTVYSDIATIDSYRCVRKSLYEAVQTVIERWGGHLVRNNFSFGILSEIGQDRGIVIQYKKNLSDIVCTENWDAVVTKILPVGQDGILLNAVNPSADIYISSSTQYDIPYTKTVDFQQDISQDDYPNETAYLTACVNDLRAQATAYLAKNCVPQVNYTLKANLDTMTDIGDTIEVIDERLGIHFLTKVISFEYDCIFEKYTEVEFGNFTQSLSGLVNTVSETASEKAVVEVMQKVDGEFTPAYPKFTQATTRANIESGDKYNTIFGKIRKFFTDLKTVAFSGSYDDLTDKPDIPAPQVNSDWDATSGVAEILNKPTIPTVNDGVLTIQQNGTTVGTFTANQSSDTTINLTGGGGSYSAGDGININSNVISVDTTFTEAQTRTNIASGDTFATILGKIKKFFTDLKTVAFSGSYSDLSNTPTSETAQQGGTQTSLCTTGEKYTWNNKQNQATVSNGTLYL